MLAKKNWLASPSWLSTPKIHLHTIKKKVILNSGQPQVSYCSYRPKYRRKNSIKLAHWFEHMRKTSNARLQIKNGWKVAFLQYIINLTKTPNTQSLFEKSVKKNKKKSLRHWPSKISKRYPYILLHDSGIEEQRAKQQRSYRSYVQTCVCKVSHVQKVRMYYAIG